MGINIIYMLIKIIYKAFGFDCMFLKLNILQLYEDDNAFNVVYYNVVECVTA